MSQLDRIEAKLDWLHWHAQPKMKVTYAPFTMETTGETSDIPSGLAPRTDLIEPPWPGYLSEYKAEIKQAAMDAIEVEWQPNACEQCGRRDIVLCAWRIGDKRCFSCGPCFPDIMSKALYA
jgi:hypothetical protein